MQAAYADLRSCREHRGLVRSHPFLTFFGMAAHIPIARNEMGGRLAVMDKAS